MAKNWDIIITNKSNLLSIDLGEVWRYRDLLVMYVKRDIITFYKQTILGPLWYIIQPILTVAMNMIVFGGIAGRRSRHRRGHLCQSDSTAARIYL